MTTKLCKRSKPNWYTDWFLLIKTLSGSKEGGVTPLHYAAEIGNLDLLSKFLEVCPTSIEDVKIRGKTVLHIALKFHHLRALKYLIKWLQSSTNQYASSWEKTLLNWEDEEGNTVLHIAVSNNQPQASSLPSCMVSN
jgi:ankyrin repeat protein